MPAGIEVARLVVPVIADTSQFEREMKRAGGVARKFGGALATVGKATISAGLGALTTAVGGFAAVVKKTLPMAADFESAVVALDIAAGESGLSFDELHEAALAVGGDARLLGVSASGAAESMTGLYKAGLSTVEIFGDVNAYLDEGAELGGALRAAIDLAASTELDMVQASDLAAVALSTFGGALETDEERAGFVTAALDNLVRAADASVADVSDLAEALKNVGPVAANFGFSLADTNNALAILSTRGIRGSEAGTALRSMLTNIMRPTNTVKEALQALNVQLYDQEGALKPLPEIVGDFQDALSGVTEEQRNQAIQTLAGTYGMRAMATLLEEGTEGWDAMADATGRATGIQEQAARKAETLAGQWEAFQGNLETLGIQIGESFLPLADQVVTTFGSLAEQYGPMVVAMFQEVSAALAGGLTVFTQGQGIFAALVEVLDNFLPEATIARIWELYDAIAPIVQQVAAWLSQNVELGDVLIGLGAAIAAVLVPAILSILPVIAVFTAVVGAVILMRKAWTENWGDIQGKTAAVVGWFKRRFAVMISFYSDLWARIEAFASDVVSAWAAIRAFISTTWRAIQSFLTTTLNAIAAVFEFVWTAIKDVLIVITGLILSILFGRWDDAALILSGIWERIKEAASTIWAALSDAVTGIVNALGAWLEEDAWPAIKRAAVEGWEEIKKAVKKKATDLWGAITEIVEDIKRTITETNWLQLGIDIITGLIDGIKDKAKALIDAVRGAVDDAIAAAKRLLGIGSPSKVFMEIGAQTMAGMGLGVMRAASLPVSATAAATATTINRTLEMTVNANYSTMQTASSVARDVATQLQLLGWT